MAIDPTALRDAVARHGRVARVIVAQVAGSTPREVGAAMLVWATPEQDGKPGGQSGTIGGGALEYDAAAQAFARSGATRHPLGPSLGQCCGGSVTLWTEHWTAADLPRLDAPALARGPGPQPMAVTRHLADARRAGTAAPTALIDGWFVEPIAPARHPLWIWGAGHVGRALVSVLAPLPGFDITWVDTGPDRFPALPPQGVRILPAPDPLRAVALAPTQAAHLIVTYSHTLDLGLCDALLGHGFGFAGLIGSDTKWARFRRRLTSMGHSPDHIDRICCPIGQKTLGKHPQAIAVGVAGQLLTLQTEKDAAGWTTSSYSLTA
ncbi:MAG: xanthine dehydrogenase accessory protein XdhC [Primorskyibacter sp.]